jgi:hypothetical protein
MHGYTGRANPPASWASLLEQLRGNSNPTGWKAEFIYECFQKVPNRSLLFLLKIVKLFPGSHCLKNEIQMLGITRICNLVPSFVLIEFLEAACNHPICPLHTACVFYTKLLGVFCVWTLMSHFHASACSSSVFFWNTLLLFAFWLTSFVLPN